MVAAADEQPAAAAAAERQNGTGPKATRREPWLDLDVPEEFPGFQMRVWLGFSEALWGEVNSLLTPQAAKAAALRKVVLEHNKWTDADGQPYPDAQAEDFWTAIPLRLAVVILHRLNAEVYDRPLFLTATRRR